VSRIDSVLSGSKNDADAYHKQNNSRQAIVLMPFSSPIAGRLSFETASTFDGEWLRY